MVLLWNIIYTHSRGPILERCGSNPPCRGGWVIGRHGVKTKRGRPEPACFSINPPPAIVSDTVPESRIKGNTPDRFTCSHTHVPTHTHLRVIGMAFDFLQCVLLERQSAISVITGG